VVTAWARPEQSWRVFIWHTSFSQSISQSKRGPAKSRQSLGAAQEGAPRHKGTLAAGLTGELGRGDRGVCPPADSKAYTKKFREAIRKLAPPTGFKRERIRSSRGCWDC
jgi:hypothetical protein